MSSVLWGDVKGLTSAAPASGNGREPLRAWVDDNGNVVLPRQIAESYGLHPGAQLLVESGADAIRLRRPVTHLTKVYVEPTNACNLSCRTCIRNVWTEPLGRMSLQTYGRILEGIGQLALPLTVSFGGFGEPLSHPDIVGMVYQAKRRGLTVELVTNATLLNAEMSAQLISAGLDVLWVSLDGASPGSYSDVRLAESLPEILANLQQFHNLRLSGQHWPELGIAFVAMKRNIEDLPAILRLGSRYGASRYSISGILPHTTEMAAEVLYSRTLGETAPRSNPWAPPVRLPRMDINDDTREALYRVLRGGRGLLAGEAPPGQKTNRCPFIEAGTTSIGWQGNVSPCLALLHEDVSFLGNRQRRALPYTVGAVQERSLSDIWMDPAYVAFRWRIQEFDFSPCTYCGGCDFSESNQEDCFGNSFPTCGGCLWAQGVIQCP